MTEPRSGSITVDSDDVTSPRVGVNLMWLVPGVVGGSEEYCVRLLSGISDECLDSVRVRIYGRQDLFATYPELGRRFHAVEMPSQPASKLRRVFLEQTWLAKVSRLDDVVHHMGGTVPLRVPPPDQRVVVTIHDLQPLDMPTNFGLLRRWWLRAMIPLAAQRADAVVCPSQFTADRIAAHRLTSADRVHVVFHGFEAAEAARTAAPIDGGASNPILPGLNGRPFVLYPAIAYRHKRHRDLIEALAHGPGSLESLSLVLTGRPGPESNEIDRLVRERGLQDRVHVLGRVPEADLDRLYRQATALAMPSEYEGFGNPCLEAMSRGCPVIAASAGSIPEVVGGAGILVPVGDRAAMTAALEQITSEPDTVNDMIALGYEQARRFAPSIASQRLWHLYRELLDLPGVMHRRP